jgi:hypothetical protein
MGRLKGAGFGFRQISTCPHSGTAVGPISHVVCFDFTTQNSDLLNLMFSFIVQFDDGPLEPMFPGRVLSRRKPAGLG